MTEGELIAAKYASYSDDELRGNIAAEEDHKALGYRPGELDIRKRGFDPAMCDMFIGQMRTELHRRASGCVIREIPDPQLEGPIPKGSPLFALVVIIATLLMICIIAIFKHP